MGITISIDLEKCSKEEKIQFELLKTILPTFQPYKSY
ncbi:Hypothetical protein EHI5A_022410 [Entamoeba histolytica KU27]|nr:Hypothetical protein EHI5A_022410 [Entamoeba histolytica KU27]